MRQTMFTILLTILGVIGADPIPEQPVGTCSVQSGEVLPDAACYDNCKDTPEQRHFLTCIEMACYCRKASPLNPVTPPQQATQAAVPLNAGGVSNQPSPIMQGQNETQMQNITVGTNSTVPQVNSTASNNGTLPVGTGGAVPMSAGAPENNTVNNSTNSTAPVNNGTANVPPINVGTSLPATINPTANSVAAPGGPVAPQIPPKP